MPPSNTSPDSESLIQTYKGEDTKRIPAELSFGGFVATAPLAFLILCLSAVVVSKAEDASVQSAAVYNLITAIITILVAIAVYFKSKKRLDWSWINIVLVTTLWILWFSTFVILTHRLRITAYPFGDPEDVTTSTKDSAEAAADVCEAMRQNGSTHPCSLLNIRRFGGSGGGNAVNRALKVYAELAGAAWACVAFNAIEVLYFTVLLLFVLV